MARQLQRPRDYAAANGLQVVKNSMLQLLFFQKRKASKYHY
ncbi:MAG: hypothetical protein ACXACI_13295 [Candidatus Hodarchaeales archaeon]